MSEWLKRNTKRIEMAKKKWEWINGKMYISESKSNNGNGLMILESICMDIH